MAKSVEWRRREFLRCLRRWLGYRSLPADLLVAHISYSPILAGDSLSVGIFSGVDGSLVASLGFIFLEKERPESAFFLLVEILKGENIREFNYDFEPSFPGYSLISQYSSDGTTYYLP